MKLLIAGNSQASCLKSALDAQPGLLEGIQPHFYVCPGGAGPFFDIQDDRLHVFPWGINEKAPPRQHPEGTAQMPLSSFDAIVVSSLGYVDGGFTYVNPITRQGLMHAFGPKPNEYTDRLISKEACRSIVSHMIGQHHGVNFLRKLRQSYGGPVIVVPYPMLSENIVSHEGWALARMYEDPAGANAFFSDARDECLAQLCTTLGARLLQRPAEALTEGRFTRSALMSNTDMLHPLHTYGRLVLQRLSTELAAAVEAPPPAG